MNPRRLLAPLLLSGTVALGACAPAATSTPVASRADANTPSASPSPPPLVDDAGRPVVLGTQPERIVSLAPSNTEIVCALDACDLLAGVTDFDDYPPQVADVEDVVISSEVDVERVVAAEPDLVIAAGNELTASSVIDQLAGLGVNVLTVYSTSLEDVYADIAMVGAAIGRSDEAEVLVRQMRDRVTGVEDAVVGLDRPRTFYEVSVFEGVIYTAGEGSFIASLIDVAGGEPVTGDALSTAIDLEDLVAADPELILLGDATYDPTVTAETVAQRPGWGEMTAVRDGRVVPVTDDVVITRPGPRIVDGLEALAHVIHPEAYE